MRLSPLILVLLLAPAAAAQTPQPVPEQTWRLAPYQSVPIPPGSEKSLSTLPPDARLLIEVDSIVRIVRPAELQELLREGKQVRPGPPPCRVDYSKVDAEKKASDQHLREMKRRGEAVPVIHQFEQEMYYEDRRTKLYEKTCGKPATTAPLTRETPPDMRKKACEALGAVCKPVKHW